MRHRAGGFSLIELVIVVAIILVIVSIAIPSLLVARQRAHEAMALGLLRTLHAEQEAYRISTQEYADTFDEITDIGQALAGGGVGGGRGRGRGRGRGGGGGSPTDVIVYSSYIFRLSRPALDEWNCAAEPTRARSSSKFFYTDNAGQIHYAIGRQATSTSPLI